MKTAPGDDYIRALSVDVLDTCGDPVVALRQDEPFTISIRYQVLQSMPNANVGFELRTEEGIVVFSSFDIDNPAWIGQPRKAGTYTASCQIPADFLNEGVYWLSLIAGIPFMRMCIQAEDILKINIGPSVRGEGTVGRLGARRTGILAPQMEWETRYLG